METILIATDFSTAARNATIYGFELAKLMKVKVILFTAFQGSGGLPDSSVYSSTNEIEKNSYKQLLDEAEAIDPRRTVALQTQSRQGPVSASILAAAIENNVSYIIVGMKERGKEIRKYFGSAVTDLCKNSQVPLIVVPADAVFSIPKTIALASDITDDTDIQILEPLKKIVEKFESRLFVVRVIKNSMDEVASRVIKSKKLIWFLTSLYPSYVFPKARNVAKAMIAFVKQYAVDLVAVIPHEHTLFERLFTKSVTKNMIFRTPVPLLILPEKKETSKEEPGKEIDGSEVISAA